jgi:hypothetical protein
MSLKDELTRANEFSITFHDLLRLELPSRREVWDLLRATVIKASAGVA